MTGLQPPLEPLSAPDDPDEPSSLSEPLPEPE
jgi:hypothetical protein